MRDKITRIEWACLEGSEYRIANGAVTVPARPGFGLSLDSDFFAEAVKQGGWQINLQKTQ